MSEEDLKNNDSPEDLEGDNEQNEGEEKIKNTKGDKFIKGLLLFTFIFLCIGIIIVVQYEIKDRSDDSNLSGIENIVYRDVQRSDISMNYDMGITSVTVVIQANNDIEEFLLTPSVLHTQICAAVLDMKSYFTFQYRKCSKLIVTELWIFRGKCGGSGIFNVVENLR